jgi:hypothetical protein
LEERFVAGCSLLCFCDLLRPLVLIIRLYILGPSVRISTGPTYQFLLVLSVLLDRVHVTMWLFILLLLVAALLL